MLQPRRADVRFGSKADMCSATRDVRFVPIADIGHFTRLSRPHEPGTQAIGLDRALSRCSR